MRFVVPLAILVSIGIVLSCSPSQGESRREGSATTPDSSSERPTISATNLSEDRDEGGNGTNAALMAQDDTLQELIAAVADIDARLSKLEKDLGAGRRTIEPIGIPYTWVRSSLNDTKDDVEEVRRCLGEVTDYIKDLEGYIRRDGFITPRFLSSRCVGF